jgi:hypothetical protein
MRDKEAEGSMESHLPLTAPSPTEERSRFKRGRL